MMQMGRQREGQGVYLQGQKEPSPVLGSLRWEGCCRHSADLWKEPGRQSQTAHASYLLCHTGQSCSPSVTGGANTPSRSAEKLGTQSGGLLVQPEYHLPFPRQDRAPSISSLLSPPLCSGGCNVLTQLIVGPVTTSLLTSNLLAVSDPTILLLTSFQYRPGAETQRGEQLVRSHKMS